MYNIIEKIFKSEVPPVDLGVLWLDVAIPSVPKLKGYVNGAWKNLADETGQIEEIIEALTHKVDKVEGKGLSTNDYTDEDVASLANKVDKETGKGLSSNDYTTAEKSKLEGIDQDAEANVIDAIKVNGTAVSPTDKTVNITVDKSTVGLGSVTNDAQVKRAEMGAANGVATLGADGKVTSSQIPALIDLLSYGIQWDITVSNPQCTRIGNPLLHAELPIQASMRGCVHTGNNIAYYLDPNDWSKKEDGVTASVLDGTDGEVGVHIMKFYGKSGANGNKRWVRISTMKIDDTWVEIPEAIVGAYRCTVNKTDNTSLKAVSVVNTTANYRGGGDRSAYDEYSANIFKTDLGKPRTALPRATMRTYATNAGSNLMFYNYYKWMCWLYYIEYANFNCQAAFNATLTPEGFHQGGLGDGISTMNGTQWSTFNGYYPLVPCGYTNEFGNGTNKKATGTITDGTSTPGSGDVPRWRGIEQPFGDIWTNLDGIICEASGDASATPSTYHRKYYATWDPTKFGDDNTALGNMDFVGEEVSANGYVGEFTLGETGEMVPANVTGGATTKKCDYHYQDSPNTGLRTVLVGGDARDGAGAGLACFYSYFGVGISSTHFGFRTIVLV